MTIDAPSPLSSTEVPPSAVPKRLMRAGTILAWLALALLVVSAALFTLPVSNPGVQSCGSPAWFLLQATQDAPLFTKQGKPINGWSERRIEQADANPCSERVADRAVPAGIALLGFWVVGLGALVLGSSGRRKLRRRSA